MKIKKIIVTIVVVSLLLSSATATAEVYADKIPVVSDFELKLSGFAHFQAGLRNQSKLAGDEKNVSSNRKNFAFFNEAGMMVDASKEVNDIKYGGKVVLVPTASRKGSPDYNGSHIYLKSDFGKIEAGSPISPSSQMMIDGGTIAAATFDDWHRYADFSTKYLMQESKVEPSFSTFAEYFLDSKLITKLDSRTYSSEPARSVAYYTPKFAFGSSTKLQIGVAYTPDSSNTGADNPYTNSSGEDTRKIETGGIDKFVIDRTVKDAFSGGVSIEQNFSDGIDAKIAVTGEYGKSAGRAKKFATANDPNPETFRLSNLRTFNIGALLNVGNFSYAGSFGSLGKSLTAPEFHKTGRKTDYYSGTVAYKQGPFAASISYFKSDQFKNTVDAVSVGTNYLLAPGFKPYAEVSSFVLKGRPEFRSDLSKKKTRGTIALIGAKLSL
ncbi:MAG: porin [Rickettsiaceae bacterium]|nr:porin [Rickettsiaceae bacterium]